MKKLFLLLCVVSLAFLIACGGKQVQSVNPDEIWVRAANSELSNHSVTGFAYKRSDLSMNNWNSWAQKSAPVISRILTELPGGYVLQVTGHTDASGPETQEGRKPGNIKLSEDRAKTVHDSLVKNKLDSPKLTRKGVGSSQPIDAVDSRDAKQRRVSFRIVQE